VSGGYERAARAVFLETLQDGARAPGDGAATDMRGIRGLTLEVAGDFTGQVAFEASITEGAYHPVHLIRAVDGTPQSTAIAPGLYCLPATHREWRSLRARVSALARGAATVRVLKSYG
jgi:hypothetical protein